MVKLGWVKTERSRREQRKEAEAEAHRGPLAENVFARENRVKPAALNEDQRGVSPVHIPVNPILTPDSRGSLPLPGQAELKRRSLRLRQQVQVIMRRDERDERIVVRNTVIEDISRAGRLLLSQTTPPVLSSDVGKMAEVSFLARYFDVPGGRWLRVGYETPILKLIKDMQLGDDYIETVFIVDPPETLKPKTVRTAFRLYPPDDLDLRLLLLPERTEVGLMDISHGGSQFFHPPSWTFNPGARLHLALVSGEVEIAVGARVVRQGVINDRLGREQGLTSVRFYGLDPSTRTRLNQLLTETYRHLLAQRSGMGRGRRL